ncbi:hypothetical protein DYB30_009717 [Aphanomyces astaci]|uniref:Protein preY, mitochondrial n=1 Tax=Aphanomyces astaci TaxID=112090 RepID=A0A397DEJ1_APHAT|nr:hypothetical protein DYB38_005357 [Aphanomyces astaci]RHY60092.1 hypothetical protein DYB30_009717 [Aphanomyces astaci]RHZ04384.1 hypothetical protein DYB26_008664 [Aphanomyces astaci]RHZ32714.1 hypothetical protein DYB31_013264 [Aphanomyces astaci]
MCHSHKMFTRAVLAWRRPLGAALLRGRTIHSSSTATLQDETVLERLVCPISKLPLEYLPAHGVLFCREIRVAYPIRHGIPILVPTEGRIVPDDEGL